MRTAQTAAAAGISARTLRYDERHGLPAEAARTESGYRDYGSEAVRTVRFVKRAQQHSARATRRRWWARPRAAEAREAARALAEVPIAELGRRIADLSAMRRCLDRLVASCARPRPERDCRCWRRSAMPAPAPKPAIPAEPTRAPPVSSCATAVHG